MGWASIPWIEARAGQYRSPKTGVSRPTLQKSIVDFFKVGLDKAVLGSDRVSIQKVSKPTLKAAWIGRHGRFDGVVGLDGLDIYYFWDFV